MRVRQITLSMMSVFLLAALSACGNNDNPTPAPQDMGPDLADMVDMGPPPDTTAPTVTGHSPDEGAQDVARAVQLRVDFSEPMKEDVGAISVTPGDRSFTVKDGSWNAARTAFFVGVDGLPPGETIQVSVKESFADEAGNAVSPASFSFVTVDDVAPAVSMTTPIEGAENRSATTDTITISFNKPMDPSSGTLALSGGPGALGDLSWTDTQTLTVPVSGLVYDTAYRVLFLGEWRDAKGNPLDLAAYLGDGVLNFSTGTDRDAPQVVSSLPTEGQMGVSADGLMEFSVTFNELMDTGAVAATLADMGGTQQLLRGVWDDDAQTIRFAVRSALLYETAYTLDLSGMRDLAGNDVDSTVYLGDGKLDFTIGADMFPPSVRGASPAEAETNVATDLKEILLVFTEPMDTTTLGTVQLTGGAAPIDLTPTWSLNDTTLTLTVANPPALDYDTTYSLALPAGLADRNGNTVDLTHPYLGDGILQFVSVPPSGEDCTQPLTVAQAVNMGGAYTWSIARDQVLKADGGGDTCDTSGSGRDVVIKYEKTTQDTANGGTMLRVTADSATTSTLNLEIGTGACDPKDASFTSQACYTSRADWISHLDVGPGTYYITVASTYSTGIFPGANIKVEEITLPTEGETCAAPFTTGSPNHAGTGTPNDPHIWNISATSMRGLDMDTQTNGPNIASCDPNGEQGADAVIKINKQYTSTLLEIEVTSDNTARDLNVALTDTCAAPRNTYRCEPDNDKHKFTVRAPSGDHYLWISNESLYGDWPNVEVKVSEISVPIGDSCATAYPLTISQLPYNQTVLQTSANRYDAPSCSGTSSNIEWYKYTVTQGVLELSANGPGAMQVFDANSLESYGNCATNAATTPFRRVLPVGTEVCIAVERDTFTSFTLNERTYSGIQDKRTQIPLTRPQGTSGPLSITGDYWLASTPTRLVMGYSSSAAATMPKAGGQMVREPSLTSTYLGYGAVSVGEDVFAVDSTSTTSSNRVHKIFDATSSPKTDWDTGITYPSSLYFYWINTDNTSLIYATRNASHVDFYQLPVAASATPVHLGRHTGISGVAGIAFDATYVYVTAKYLGQEGVFRIARADLSMGSSAPVTKIDEGDTSQYSPGHLYVDDYTNPQHLYWREYGTGKIRAIIEPDSATPTPVGPISNLGRTGDYAFTYDPGEDALYVFDTTLESTGGIYKLTK